MNSLAGPLYVVVGVLAVAGGAKAFAPAPTAAVLRRLRVPMPLRAARLLGLIEVAVAVAAVATGATVAWALVACCYAAFTVFVLWALQADEPVGSCGCFGQEDTPPTAGHAGFNAAAAALAALAALDPVRLGDLDLRPGLAAAFLLIVVIGVGASVLALTSLPRLLALVRGGAAPAAPQFSLDRTATTER